MHDAQILCRIGNVKYPSICSRSVMRPRTANRACQPAGVGDTLVTPQYNLVIRLTGPDDRAGPGFLVFATSTPDTTPFQPVQENSNISAATAGVFMT